MKFNFSVKQQGVGISKAQIISALARGWQRSYKFLLFILIVCAFFFGWYVWQRSLSGNAWSEEKKQEYIKSQNTGVIFNQGNFEKVLADVEMRKNESAMEAQQFRDIFKFY